MKRLILAGLAMTVLLAAVPVVIGAREVLSRATGAAASPALSCVVRDPGPCSGGEVEVFRMSGVTNAHAQTAGGSYLKAVCCSGPTGLSNSCSGSYDTVLWLSATDNAHAAQASGGAYTTQVCLGADAGIDCQYETGGAACDAGYACLATMSGTTNAHVDVCDASNDYDTKVCCAEQAACTDHDGDTACADPVNDQDDDGCTAAEEAALGAEFSDTVWYDVFDVQAPVKSDAAGANRTKNRIVDIQDALAVLFYFGANNDAGENGNGVDYDTVKGVDLDGDSATDVGEHPELEEGLKYDRTPGAGLSAGAPNGYIDIADALVNLKQFGMMAAVGGACDSPFPAP